MRWIVEATLNVILEIINDILALTSSLIADLKLDIGYAPDSPAWSFTDPGQAGQYGILGKYLPGAAAYGTVFLVLGMVLVFIIVIFKLYQGMLGPFTDAENPIEIVIRACLASFGVVASFSIFTTFEKMFNKIYGLFLAVFMQQTDIGNFANLFSNKTVEKAGKTIVQPGRGNSFLSTLPKTEELKEQTEAIRIFGQDMIKNGKPSLGLFVIEVILGCALIYAFIRLVLEIYQRYVTIGLLFYSSPLAFSMLVSRSTKNIFSAWIQMLFSEFILMCINLFFVGTYTSAMYNIFSKGVAGAAMTADGRPKYLFETNQQFVVVMLILIAWLIVGQKTDEYMRSLGLSVAQTGAGLGAALAGGYLLAKTGVGIARSGMRVGNSAFRAASKVDQGLLGGKVGAGLREKLGGTIPAARDAGGHITNPSKAAAALNSGKLTGENLRQASESLGVSGAMSSMVSDGQRLDLSSSVGEKGLISVAQTDGVNSSLAGEIADKSIYNPDSTGIAYKDVGVNNNYFAPVTNEMLKADSEKAVQALRNKGIDARVVSTNVGEQSRGSIEYKLKDGSYKKVYPEGYHIKGKMAAKKGVSNVRKR